MKVAVEEVAKKLVLWHTRTFRPILTHEDLEPIMSSAGFVPLPVTPSAGGGGVEWREYAFPEAGAVEEARDEGLPRPRLPYPRLDGVHLLAYRAFFDAIEFYVGSEEVPNLFHVRPMPITRAQDRAFEKSYRPMKDCDMGDEGIYLYREGTLDHITKAVCNHSGSSSMNRNKRPSVALMRRDSSNASSPICLVPLTDLFPSRDILSLG